MGGYTNDRARRGALTAVSVVLCGFFHAATVHAQVTVGGMLYDDSTGTPVRGTVMLIDAATDVPIVHTSCDSSGRFLLTAAPGVYRIAAVREKYASTLSAPVSFQRGDRMVVRIPIAVAGNTRHKIGVLQHTTLHDANSATTHDANPYVAGFQQRGSGNPGLRYTRADFDRSGVSTVGQFLQGLPGVSLISPTSMATAQMSRNSGIFTGLPGQASSGSCHVGWFLDGHRMDLAAGIDYSTDQLGDILLDAIEGVEVFRGVSEMPAEFASPDLRCGAVAIWMRR